MIEEANRGMKTILQLAQAWLEHCREQAEYFDREGDDGIAMDWHANADAAERSIKNYIDGGHT